MPEPKTVLAAAALLLFAAACSEPVGYHPVVDTVDESRLKSMMSRVRADIARAVGGLKSHDEYIRQHPGGAAVRPPDRPAASG